MYRGLLCGKLRRGQEAPDAGTSRVGWATAMGRYGHSSPNYNKYKDNEHFWKINNTIEDIAKAKGVLIYFVWKAQAKDAF